MAAPPPITVGLPAFDGERFLAQALDSILAQTFTEFTLVVSDNGSTDATAEIVRDYARRDPRIRLIRNRENRGAAWNHNRVFAECESPFFRWASADDMLAPTLLERSLDVLEDAPEDVVLVYPQTLVVDEEGEVLRLVEDDLAAAPGAAPHARLLRVLRKMVYGNTVYSLVRASALRRTRLHRSFPSADYVLLAELALAGEFRRLDEPLFLRRFHPGMSLQANPTTADLTRWFDPRRSAVKRPQLTLFVEHLRGVRHAQLAPPQRTLAYLACLAMWARRDAPPRARSRRAVRRLRGLAVGAVARVPGRRGR
jgi:glycosyltransferase involved in cell wall biosynthesis